MKKLIIIGLLIQIYCQIGFTQNYSPTEGYVIFDELGIARSVMNLNIDRFLGTDQQIADQYLAENKNWICAGENGNYYYFETKENIYSKHVVYMQKVNNTPVLGSELIISLNKNNHITFIYNGYKTNIGSVPSPVISGPAAITTALNTFPDPLMKLTIPVKSEIVIYVDSLNNSHLVWKVGIAPVTGGDWLVYVDAVNSSIILKKDIAFGENGSGKVWDPEPGTYLNNTTIPDNNDNDNPLFAGVYQTKVLLGLIPQNNLYYLRGEYAYSNNFNNDFVLASSTIPDFNFNRSQTGFEEVNCYYHLDKQIRYIRGLGFDPLWDNGTNNPKDIIFYARGDPRRGAFYYSLEDFITYGIPADYPDAGEDESVIVHELGHAFHDALLIGGTAYLLSEDCIGIGEGISDYLAIDYRRQLSFFNPNDRCNWFWPGVVTIVSSDVYGFSNHWTAEDGYGKMQTWASALMELEYNVETDPASGYFPRMNRDVVTTNQLAALSYISHTATVIQNVLAMYQADIDIYNGAHLQKYIDVYNNRKLFNNQNVFSNILQSTSWSGFKKINGTIKVLSGATLEIADNTVLVMDGELDIENNATLIIGEGVQIYGYKNTDKIVVDGNIQFNGTFEFKYGGDDNNYFGGLYMNNRMGQLDIFGSTFNNTRIVNNGNKLNIILTTFENGSYIESKNGNITLTHCWFLDSKVYFENRRGDPKLLAKISNCDFSSAISDNGIELFNYGKYLIEGNEINGYYNGIKISNCGFSESQNQLIENNLIYNCSMSGIEFIGSIGTISKNNIHNNLFGIRMLNKSNIILSGNKTAHELSETQQITDNERIEVYAGNLSFPVYFTYNAIIDEDNRGGMDDALVYYERPSESVFVKLSVENNWWGNNFRPSEDLITINGIYKWSPTWCPSNLKSSITEIEDQYSDALNDFNTGNYSQAKEIFLSIIHNDPTSYFAQASMKELFSLESFANNDFLILKNYFTNDDSIIADTVLKELGDHLSNKCNIALKKWPEVISWYENKILNPGNLEDSIFAIIDIGNVYLMIENEDQKSTLVGSLAQFKPKNEEIFKEKCKYLLTLLPRKLSENKSENLLALKNGYLTQNCPNPFSANTRIYFKIENISHVVVSITDLTGKKVYQIDKGNVNKGTHMITILKSTINPGIYFYSLILNGIISDTKRMIVY